MKSISKTLFALAVLALGCDDPSMPCSGETETSTETTGEGTETGEPVESVPACCMCLDGALECVPSESAGQCGIIGAELGTPGLQLECTPTPEDPEGCPDIDCTPPDVSCCSCIDGVEQCIAEPVEGCTIEQQSMTGCTIDILGGVACGLAC